MGELRNLSKQKLVYGEDQDQTLKKWLAEFKKGTTTRTYRSALKRFKKEIDITDLGVYVKNDPDVVADARAFLAALDGHPAKTIGTYIGAVKMFMQDHDIKIPDTEWRKIRRRGFMPKRLKPETRDKKPSKSMLKQILNYADIKCRSMVLFLVSSGARIGETMQLRIEDFHLDADPPRATIRSEYTKGGMGGRTVYYSYEARDAINDWLRIKDEIGKRTGEGTYKSDKMFPWNTDSARYMWNKACKKAALNIRDSRTNRRIYHLHSLRKFFRTKIGLDLDVTHALMGHAEYLDDAYLRLEESGEIARAYEEAMPNVSVYQIEDQELKMHTSMIEQENIDLKARIGKVELEIVELKKMIESLIS